MLSKVSTDTSKECNNVNGLAINRNIHCLSFTTLLKIQAFIFLQSESICFKHIFFDNLLFMNGVFSRVQFSKFPFAYNKYYNLSVNFIK